MPRSRGAGPRRCGGAVRDDRPTLSGSAGARAAAVMAEPIDAMADGCQHSAGQALSQMLRRKCHARTAPMGTKSVQWPSAGKRVRSNRRTPAETMRNSLIELVPQEGIEPPTHALRMRCSTPELLRLAWGHLAAPRIAAEAAERKDRSFDALSASKPVPGPTGGLLAGPFWCARLACAPDCCPICS